MSRILVTGAEGQVGHELVRSLAAIGEVIPAGRDRLDLSQSDTLRQAIYDLKPDLIINAAAYTAVDKAESEPDLANQINGVAPTLLAEAAVALNVGLIHISTDYVFDGQRNTPYLESDVPNPIGAYGWSKRQGEVGIQQVFAQASGSSKATILRTAWVYGTSGKGNFVKTMLRLGESREEVRVVIDQVGSPTWARDLAIALTGFAVRHLRANAPLPFDGKVASVPPDGIYHYSNSGVISWYDFAVAIFEEAKALGFPLKVQRVIPISSADYPTPVTRPSYSALSGQKTAALLGAIAPYWRTSLRQMLTELYTQTHESHCSIGR